MRPTVWIDEEGSVKAVRMPRSAFSRIYVLMLVFTLGEGALRFLVPLHVEAVGGSLAAVGAVTSSFALATLVARVPAGALFRPGRARSAILLGGAVSSLAFLATPFTSHTGLLVVLMFVDGLGWGTVTTLLLTLMLASRSPEVPASTAMGWYVGVTGIGHALAGVTAGALADAFGLRVAFLVLAGLPVAAVLLLFGRLQSAASWARHPAGAPAGGGATAEQGPRQTQRGFRALPLAVWVAGSAALYLNVMNGILNTFFPILALALGFSLSQAGLLTSLRSGVSALARFAAIPLFERVAPIRLRLPLMATSAVTTILVPLPTTFLVQSPLWALNGASRGFVRVGTGADAMESLSPGQEGRAAAVMSAGLDVGKLVGPLTAGVIADRLGTPSAFYVLPGACFVAYLVLELARLLRDRSRTGVATTVE